MDIVLWMNLKAESRDCWGLDESGDTKRARDDGDVRDQGSLWMAACY